MKTIYDTKNLYGVLNYIRDSQTFLMGHRTLHALYIFVNAYTVTCQLKQIDEKLQPDFKEFNDFVAKYYSLSSSTEGWENMILQNCDNDQEKAFDKFFELLYIFKSQNKADT